MAAHINTEPIGSEQAAPILALRLVIARAASADSLAWWDDESLTSHASYLLERIFPFAPSLAARKLALAAALARHEAACPSANGAVHLYRLDTDNRDGLALRSVPLVSIPVPEEPITTLDSLRQHLLDLAGQPARYTVVRQAGTRELQIEIPPAPPAVSPMVHRALARAYLDGAPGEPAFPFCVE